MDEVGKKRKRVVLTVVEKLAICDALANKSVSPKELATRYNVGTSTISDIRKSESKLRDFVMEKAQIGLKGAAKVAKSMKTSDFEELDKVLYIWFRQLREKNIPVSGPILMEKASEFFQRLSMNE